jgi:hypothetical protein
VQDENVTENPGEWKFVADSRRPAEIAPSRASLRHSTLTSKVSWSTSYIVLAITPCNDYAGAGRAGGDLACFPSDEEFQRGIVYASLGGGAISKMPSIRETSRPDIKNVKELNAYSVSGGDDYVPWTAWQKVDLSNFPATALPARFGHAMVTVSGSRVLIYGGVGCSSFDPHGNCQASIVFDDLWEFDLMRWTGSGNPLKVLTISPSLSGLAGASLIAVPGEDHRVLVFGGTGGMHPVSDRLGLELIDNGEKFDFRELLFRASKAVSMIMTSKDAISFSSSARNRTHVMLFGGYLGNSRTAAWCRDKAADDLLPSPSPPPQPHEAPKSVPHLWGSPGGEVARHGRICAPAGSREVRAGWTQPRRAKGEMWPRPARDEGTTEDGDRTARSCCSVFTL